MNENEFLSKVGFFKFENWICKNCVFNLMIENLTSKGDLAFLKEISQIYLKQVENKSWVPKIYMLFNANNLNLLYE